MKVLCYVAGKARSNDRYSDVTPEQAAQTYVEEWHDDTIDIFNVVVEPLDDEAGALEGWTTRPDGARVRLFNVTTLVQYRTEEVQSFDASVVP